MITSWILVVVLHGDSTKFYSQEFKYESHSTCKMDAKEWSTRPHVVSTHCKKLVSK